MRKVWYFLSGVVIVVTGMSLLLPFLYAQRKSFSPLTTDPVTAAHMIMDQTGDRARNARIEGWLGKEWLVYDQGPGSVAIRLDMIITISTLRKTNRTQLNTPSGRFETTLSQKDFDTAYALWEHHKKLKSEEAEKDGSNDAERILKERPINPSVLGPPKP